MCLWQIVLDPNVRILIYSDSSIKAENFLKGIKSHIEGTDAKSRFREIFGEYATDARTGKWSAEQITVIKRTSGSVEPTIDTGGVGVSKVGMHYDIIMFDDIVSKLNVSTKTQMDKVFECYNESLALLKPKGLIFMTGTRWHFNDAYGRIIDRNKEFDDFDIMIKDAETKREDGKFIYEDIGLDDAHLNSLKASMGSYTYACLMKNTPVSSEEAIFKEEYFKFYEQLQESEYPDYTGKFDFLYVTATLDPSGEGKDLTGGTVVGTDHLMNMYILEVVSRKMTTDQMIEWIFKMNHIYKIRNIGIETNMFHGLLEKEINRRMKIEQIENINFHMFGITEFRPSAKSGQSKFMRMTALQPYFQRGQILFPGRRLNTLRKEVSDLAYQMLQLTPTHMPEPNDALDAFAMQVDLIRSGGVIKKDKIIKGTPQWLEKKMITQHNEMQKRLPLRLRKFWKPSLS
jgi:hypothetical protein